MSERFVKRRDYRGDMRLFKRLRRSKSSREFKAYSFMASHGIPCPRDVTIEDKRNFLGLLEYGELVMEKLEDALDLRYIFLLDEHRELIKKHEFRQGIITELAKWVRTMHDSGFYHLNLNFRNVLAKINPPLPVQLIFIDAASAKIHPTSRVDYYQMKEIAFLYKDARAWFTPREMMQFLHLYLGCKKLSREQHDFALKLIAYARKKWKDRSSTVND